MAIEHGETWRLWGPHKLEFMCHMASFSCNFDSMGSLMFLDKLEANTLGHISHRLNWEGNVTCMGEEESNGCFLDTWGRFPNIYDTNDEDTMKFMTY